MLIERVFLPHRDQRNRLCFFVDARNLFLIGIVSQIPYGGLNLPYTDQAHEPLTTLSGHLNAKQTRSYTVQKEAYAIKATVEHMHSLASEPQDL